MFLKKFKDQSLHIHIEGKEIFEKIIRGLKSYFHFKGMAFPDKHNLHQVYFRFR